MVFQPARGAPGARVIAHPGKGIVMMPKGVRITDADVAGALEEML
jgi:hypothetical protein